MAPADPLPRVGCFLPDGRAVAVFRVDPGVAGQPVTDSLERQLQGRARTLGGSVTLDAVPGWGSHAVLVLPLDPPAGPAEETRLTDLDRRELEVLRLVARGRRNKAIALELGIAESTVKFHVAGVLRKLDVSSRGEAAAPALSAGLDGLTDTGPRAIP